MWWQWWLPEHKALWLQKNKTEKGELIKLADELKDRVNGQEWITFVMFADSWLPLPLCVSSNYTDTYGRGREGDERGCETRTWTKPETETGGQRLNTKPWQTAFGAVLFSCQELFRIRFICSAFPPTHTPTPLDGAPDDLCPVWLHSSQHSLEKQTHSASFSAISPPVLCLRAVKPLFCLSGFVCI